jgi:hypothetical protein
VIAESPENRRTSQPADFKGGATRGAQAGKACGRPPYANSAGEKFAQFCRAAFIIKVCLFYLASD